MNISMNVTPEITEKIQEQMEKELPSIIEKVLLGNDKKILKDILHQSVKGIVSNEINNVLQDKDFRKFVRDEVMNFFNKEVK